MPIGTSAVLNTVSVGEIVDYFPHVCHAQNRCRVTGDYPWVMGVKRVRVDAATTPPKREEFVQELSDAELDQYFDWIRRLHPDGAEQEKKNLVFLRPRRAWNARVVRVNDDGTVDLAVDSNQGGVTLNYYDVPVVGQKFVPHSCNRRA